MTSYRGHQLLQAALVRPSTAGELEAWLLSRGSRGFRQLDRELRHRKAYEAVGLSLSAFAELAGDHAGEHTTAVLCCLSMQRDGYVRQRAIEVISSRGGRLALAALVNRVGDPVEPVATAANDALVERLQKEADDDVIWTLPLVGLIELTTRGADGGWTQRFADRLRASDAALCRAMHDADKHVRLAAFMQLVSRTSDSDVAGILRAALADKDPSIRFWAGHRVSMLVRSNETAPFIGLLGRMAENRSPAVRLLAVRALHRRGDVERLREASFDGNANIRFYARRYLAKSAQAIDYGGEARRRLARSDTSKMEVLGALAVLSELGQPSDLPLIQRFVQRPGRVGREARRAAQMLGGSSAC